uniref:Uncharacterized protein n=1 Tax=Arion vulgaris TaxID=1028688 RepID=A0A0B7BFB3_9EUPU
MLNSIWEFCIPQSFPNSSSQNWRCTNTEAPLLFSCLASSFGVKDGFAGEIQIPVAAQASMRTVISTVLGAKTRSTSPLL